MNLLAMRYKTCALCVGSKHPHKKKLARQCTLVSLKLGVGAGGLRWDLWGSLVSQSGQSVSSRFGERP